ncbi:hypothetical protein PSH58_19310 [Pseudomonas hefeiensis]|uniref:Uncharacterized protein n=1 Tax=Pseudomonas hefeiensis TaxID=2738125 RepID=A0ABY9G5W3_9PSED|nr:MULTISPECIES: hypothetical protein [unclassified Pseudomonas]WLH11010.1 hypothetical protein PSH57_19285 [Pseudomonas sp. FP205]WLH94086.1 hypothetical protein PSH58_19310 [Pseudomonas sp. FP53]WLI38363.1 hypothetical protein PSH74_19245 [Pseudomonas sp. FP821]
MTDQMAFADVVPAKQSAATAKRIQANVQDLVKRVVADLSKLETDMSKCTKILCAEDVPERYLEGHPFGLIADNLRFAEKKLREVGTPVGREKEFNTLLRAVAKARSVAAMNDSLVRQRTIVPNVIESDIDLEGLKTLTARNTQRLIDQVG